MAAKLESKDDIQEENAIAEIIDEDGWSEWKRMLNNCEWKFKDGSAPSKYADVDDELKQIIQAMGDKKIKPTRIRSKNNLLEALKGIECYQENKAYIDKYLLNIEEKIETQSSDKFCVIL